MSQEARGISRNLRLPLTIGQNCLENRILIFINNHKTFSHFINEENILSHCFYTITQIRVLKSKKFKYNSRQLHACQFLASYQEISLKNKPESVFGLQMQGIRYFQNLRNLRNCLEILWIFLSRILWGFLEDFLRGIFRQ